MDNHKNFNWALMLAMVDNETLNLSKQKLSDYVFDEDNFFLTYAFVYLVVATQIKKFLIACHSWS